MILNSLSKSNYTVKNSWEFQKNIATKSIPDGHVMISLDVVAMFPNIPLDLVKKAVSNRLIKVKSQTILDKKEFLKGLDFIMNSTKFEFNGKFYKQKFGTPIGSVISPMMAEIVMEDLEKTVFDSLEFFVPFYFRYVDDTLLCVPLDKLQKLIDTFNNYHLRIPFTHEMERNDRIRFLDLEIIKLDNGKIVSNWYRRSTYLHIFWSKFGCVFCVLRIRVVSSPGCFNCAFVWTLREIRVSEATGSGSRKHIILKGISKKFYSKY